MKLIFSSIVLNYPALAVCAVTSQRPVLWSKKQLEELKHNCTKSRSLAQTLNRSPEWSASRISLACTALISVVDRGSDLFRTTSCDFGRVYLFSDAAVWFRTGQFPSPFGHFRLIVLSNFGGLRLILEGFVLFRTVSSKILNVLSSSGRVDKLRTVQPNFRQIRPISNHII